MPLGLTGDFAGLDEVIGKLEGMRDLAGEIATEASAELESTVDSQFTLGVDPYGRPWAPLSPSTLAKGRHAPPLTDTGAMRSSVVIVARGDGIEAIVSDPAGYHQDGTVHMPARPIIPSDAHGLPPSWDASIRDAAMRVVERRWGQ